MHTKIIESHGEVIAHIYDLTQVSGKNFPTPDSFPMQFGVGVASEDWTSKAHIHKPVLRKIEGTAEFIFIMEGRLDAIIFDQHHAEVARETLTGRMALLQISGGHELSFSKGTIYFELKQGPYNGRDWDKYDL